MTALYINPFDIKFNQFSETSTGKHPLLILTQNLL